MKDRPDITAQEALKMLGLRTFKSLQVRLKTGELVPYVYLDRDGNVWEQKKYGVRDKHPKWFYDRRDIERYQGEHGMRPVTSVDDGPMKLEVISIAQSLTSDGDIPRMDVFASMRDRHRNIGMRRMYNFVRTVLNSEYGVRPYKQARKKRDERSKETI